MTSKTILSSNGIHRLHHAFFIPKGEIRATLLIVHSMSEHSGRYADFAQCLTNHGILVATYDQLGHGQTVKDKYELGFIDEKHPIQALCKDVVIMADKLKDKARTLTDRPTPHYIMGHSMGSFVVRTVLTHHATSFDGAIIMGTGNSFGIINHFALTALGAMNYINPKRPNTRFATLLNHYLLSQIRSPISASPFAWLTENIDSIKAFEADPLCGFAFSNNGFVALQGLIKKAINPAWYAHTPKDFGILLVSGKDDPVGRMGQDIADLQDELIKHGKSVTAQLYPNMRHEILHEMDKDKVHQDILGWLNHHIGKID
ncbi:alpha/beta fold hydrolase [Moraxella equi]|uniref:Lysophospholipase n=1 Tax=Moraxella equi TaxID=60442 RepID=A0A378QQZ9_9GAMM|nr:alpha/beta fold hydrolase [Moraxella equi]OPH39404.1 lysophospholipase [Moraxella equi]STZ03305.1 Putative lysophospholipase [Moraxella equi]